MKRIFRRLAAGIVALLLIPVCAVILLYFPLTQQWGSKWGILKLKEQSGLEIHVREVRVRWPLRIEITGIQVDTLLSAERLSTNIRPYPLLQGKIEATHLTLQKTSLHTDTLTTPQRIDGDIQCLHLKEIEYTWKKKHLEIERITLNGCTILLEQPYETAQKKNERTSLPLTVHIGNIDLNESAFRYSRGESNWTLTEITAHIDSISHSPISTSATVTAISFFEEKGIRLREGIFTILHTEEVTALPYFLFRTDDSYASGNIKLARGLPHDGNLEASVAATVGNTDLKYLARTSGTPFPTVAEQLPKVPLTITLDIEGTLDTLHINECNVSLPTAIDIEAYGDLLAINNRQRKADLHFKLHTWELGFLASTSEGAIAIPDSIIAQGDASYSIDSLHTKVQLNTPHGSAALDAGYNPSTQSYSVTATLAELDIRELWPQGTVGNATLQASITGKGFNLEDSITTADARLHIDSLQWGEKTIANATIHSTLDNCSLYATAVHTDTLRHLHLRATALLTGKSADAHLFANIADTDLTTHLYITPDSLTLGIRSHDLHLALKAHTIGLPWQWELPDNRAAIDYTDYLTNITAELSIGNNNPVSHHLSLLGINYNTIQGTVNSTRHGLMGQLAVNGLSAKGASADSLSLIAHYTEGALYAQLQSGHLEWSKPTMQLSTSLQAVIVWSGNFSLSDLSGTLYLANTHYALSTYSLQIEARDTLSIPFSEGEFTLTNLPLYPGDSKRPLMLNGHINLQQTHPTLHITLKAQGVDLLQRRTPQPTLYGSALIGGQVAIDGPYNALQLTGNLQLRTGSHIHYIYKDAILASANQIDNVVTFTDFTLQEKATIPTKNKRYASHGFSMDLGITIDPTVDLEIMLGGSGQNTANLQGGGNLNLQYIPASGIRLSGKYTIEAGTLNMNIPLLHVHQMSIRSGSTLQWSGDAANPMLSIVAEDRIRASVTLDGSPQSVLFLTGVSLSNTMDKLGLQFTLTAPESASMQNTLASLSPDERNKLAVALLTTGLYLGEGGTGNLMNTALLGFLQSQLDDISRNTFRTVDVSIGIEPLQDGMSGVSTRTDYSFSIAKRIWNDRIRIVIGGSVTTSNERIDSDAIINNISIEWRIVPNGSQYLRFFYDKNYENILEGEIRETGVGYAYRRRF